VRKLNNFMQNYYKVPFRDVYCETFKSWVAQIIKIFIVYKLDPPIIPRLDELTEKNLKFKPIKKSKKKVKVKFAKNL